MSEQTPALSASCDTKSSSAPSQTAPHLPTHGAFDQLAASLTASHAALLSSRLNSRSEDVADRKIQETPAKTKTAKRVRHACDNCRRSKTACSETRPCTRCVKQRVECVSYTPSKKKSTYQSLPPQTIARASVRPSPRDSANPLPDLDDGTTFPLVPCQEEKDFNVDDLISSLPTSIRQNMRSPPFILSSAPPLTSTSPQVSSTTPSSIPSKHLTDNPPVIEEKTKDKTESKDSLSVDDILRENRRLRQAVALLLSPGTADKYRNNAQVQELIYQARTLLEPCHSFHFFTLGSEGSFVAKSCWDIKSDCRLVEYNTIFENLIPTEYFSSEVHIHCCHIFPSTFFSRCRKMQMRFTTGMVKSISMIQRYWKKKRINVFEDAGPMVLEDTMPAYSTAFVEFEENPVTGAEEPRFIKLFSNFDSAPKNPSVDECFLPLVVRLNQPGRDDSYRVSDITKESFRPCTNAQPLVPRSSSPPSSPPAVGQTSSTGAQARYGNAATPSSPSSAKSSSSSAYAEADMGIWGAFADEMQCDSPANETHVTSIPSMQEAVSPGSMSSSSSSSASSRNRDRRRKRSVDERLGPEQTSINPNSLSLSPAFDRGVSSEGDVQLTSRFCPKRQRIDSPVEAQEYLNCLHLDAANYEIDQYEPIIRRT